MREANQRPSNAVSTVGAADTRGVNSDTPEHSADIRQGRELLQATRPFAQEAVSRSWWYVITTFSLMIAALAGAGRLADPNRIVPAWRFAMDMAFFVVLMPMAIAATLG